MDASMGAELSWGSLAFIDGGPDTAANTADVRLRWHHRSLVTRRDSSGVPFGDKHGGE
ncbi:MULTISPECIES: hypothetical protein [unclassified Nocardioides]|uniref:hypothetical protein n=1 Tax=unclassified Nocardioides TaxID=2615069 RepID=UPI0013050AD9|nr:MULTISPECIES: hypothetical protein [unclassified Nocardioides]